MGVDDGEEGGEEETESRIPPMRDGCGVEKRCMHQSRIRRLPVMRSRRDLDKPCICDGVLGRRVALPQRVVQSKRGAWRSHEQRLHVEVLRRPIIESLKYNDCLSGGTTLIPLQRTVDLLDPLLCDNHHL